MSEITLDPGVVLGVGGTNARFGIGQDGDISNFHSMETPDNPAEFFKWMSRQALNAADNGLGWLVAGLPGPVSPDGVMIGPMENVPGLATEQYCLTDELVDSDPAFGRLLDDGFVLVAVNDGELAAQAAAARIGEHRFGKTAALILGTGVGAGVTVKDSAYSNVHRADKTNPFEIGHAPLSLDPDDTFENQVSGPALAKEYGVEAQDIPSGHPAWERVSNAVARMAITLGVMNGVELVVPCGGVGSGASEKFFPQLRAQLADYRKVANETQKLFLPQIIPVPSSDAQVFELFGGEGVMRDFKTAIVA